MFVQVSRVSTVFFCLCLVLAPVALSQGIGGAISGRVSDPNGPVTGALVRIENFATGQARSVGTDKEGKYEARELPPGRYNIIVEQGGYKTVRITDVQLSVGQNARLQNITLAPIPLEPSDEDRKIVVTPGEVALIDATTPTLSTSFSEKQIRELPILSRDLNNLALLAPGVFSVRAFSFASTLVPFAANGSRGRDNNFIIDSVDNNEPLFGGAATQFTNTDLFAEYRILTNQYKAEYGRNSGSVVNIITERGGNQWRGTAFWFGQHDKVNATSEVERISGLTGPTRYYENILGATVGGPIKKESAWVFASYQWDHARNDLTPLFPIVTTQPTAAGLSALSLFSFSETVNSLLAAQTATTLPLMTTPCGSSGSGLPATNPCTIGSVNVFPGVPIEFGTFLVPRSGVFDVRDHQGSLRYDQRLGGRDDIYVRYLFDDLSTPRTTGFSQAELAFSDFGLFPDWRAQFLQRTQNLGIFWTHAWPTKLHELRISGSRISSQTGSFGVSESTRETLPAQTVFDGFALNVCDPSVFSTCDSGATLQGTANFLTAFVASGAVFTLGRDTRPARVNSNIFQLQDNMSMSIDRHSVKFGANFVRTQSNIRQTPSDLGQYFYASAFGFPGFDNFVFNDPIFAFQRFPNFLGSGGDVLPLREFAGFFFIQDDIQVRPNFTFNIGLRYENYGQAINAIGDINPNFGGRVKVDRNNLAPRVGFAWSPRTNLVVRGGYGWYYNPTIFNLALLIWQSGRVSPFIADFFPSNRYPAKPFNAADLLQSFIDCGPLAAFAPSGPTFLDCTTDDTVSRDLVQPYVQNYSLGAQQQFGKDFLFEAVYVGSKGTKLFQRLDRNPVNGWIVQNAVNLSCSAPPCILGSRPRINNQRGPITEVVNGANSIYHALQLSATKRLSRPGLWDGLALTTAYTWSHMIDNASEIFGPGVRYLPGSVLSILGGVSANTVEVITPFAQDPNNASSAERGNSSFDRRHRLAISYVWALPSPSGPAKPIFGDWQLNGFVTAQSGQPFSPLNAFDGPCRDYNGDGVLTNDRPAIGNPAAPITSVALLRDTNCANTALGYVDLNGNPTSPSIAHFVQVPRGVRPGSTFTVNGIPLVAGNAARNSLVGPRNISFDLAVLKNVAFGEHYRFQFRVEAYNLLNSRNPGSPIGNVFTTDAQPVPAVAFGPAGTPSRVTGVIPENSLDAADSITGESLFLSRRYMNTANRRFQFAVKFLF